ncbi:carboxylating nicotinate-nucleotide diphosphorylase [uncultured Thomasclavelia sp.]|uniref:carboxylating nicotinate-nucleotide diphosphorylase n=1 Tax=uncultured Thomasclavelia sp. TaxID=3025759 RepID=UPI0025D4B123|nr:carboxylating nicotinate-nucleotide diphosphorylase [uncultured Thomasclavelia sp.]
MINGVNLKVNIDEYILNALKEDITSEDVTTNAIMPRAQKGKVELICKQDGILCGLEVYERTFKLLDPDTCFKTSYHDGDQIKNGDLIGVVTGDIRILLSGERVALNYLQRMSGIATYTNKLVNILKDTKTKLLDTRKTTPNNRVFEKYAVKVGGGTNHRYNLSDGILIKDNHIGAAGSISKAVALARDYAPFVRKIEVEVETLEQVQEAIAAKADIIMLDNMDNETMKQAVKLIDHQAQTECSGNVTEKRLLEIAEIGVDFVSSGAITYNAPILDFSMKNLIPIE